MKSVNRFCGVWGSTVAQKSTECSRPITINEWHECTMVIIMLINYLDHVKSSMTMTTTMNY